MGKPFTLPASSSPSSSSPIPFHLHDDDHDEQSYPGYLTWIDSSPVTPDAAEKDEEKQEQ